MSLIAPLNRPEPIGAHHRVEGFDCGSLLLDEYLAKHALANHQAGTARMFVATGESQVVVAYYNHFLWMKLFAKIAGRRPKEAIRALELTVEAAQAGSIAFWDDAEAMTILKAVWGSNDTEVRTKAQRVQNLLLKMGRKQFLSVVPSE
jgi:hypothetical protein